MKKNIIIIGIVLIGIYVLYYYNKSSNTQNSLNTPLIMKNIPTVDISKANFTQSYFIPSDSFQGYKQGYVFKMGDEGLGYYID
jgi:hypothetical protein